MAALRGKQLRDYAIGKRLEFREALDRVVIGQDEAKDVGVGIAYLIHAHLMTGRPHADCKTDVLFIGPSGVGKTLLARSITDLIQVPYSEFPLTRVSETGYVGKSVDSAFKQYIHNTVANETGESVADKFYSSKKGFCGIVLYDELDKILGPKRDGRLAHDVQKELLDILQGVTLGIEMGQYEEEIFVDTRGITFICTGAFEGLETIIAERVGLDPEETPSIEIYRNCTPADLDEYGMSYQLARRFDRVVFLQELDKSQLKDILVNSVESPLKAKVRELKEFYGTRLVVDEEVYDYIVDLARIDRKLGAGALTRICNELVEPIKSDLSTYVVQGKIRMNRSLAEDILGRRCMG